MSLTFPATGYAAKRPLRILLDGRLLAEYTIPAAPYDRTVKLLFLLPAGEHALSFQSTASATADGRRFSVSIEQMEVEASYLAESPDRAPQLSPPPVIEKLSRAPCQ